jgi:OmpA-OmpF porin, OOP family
MKFKRTTGTVGLAVLAAFASTAAVAQDSGWYGGLSIGTTKAEIEDERIQNGLRPRVVTSIEDDGNDRGFKVFGGRKFNRNFALEAGYFDLGEFGYTANMVGGAEIATLKLKGFNIDAVGIYPFTEKFSALGRLGLTYTQAKTTFGSSGAIQPLRTNAEKDEANIKVGLGLQYAFTPALALRGEWERYRANDAVGNEGDVDMFSVGLVYTFGAGEKSAPKAAAQPQPAPVAAAPAPAPAPVQKPAPVLVIVPVVAKTQQYCSILDIQFEINQKTVQREAEEKIDKVALFMKKYPNTTAVIEGHSDEVGSASDNMKLSERRAESVVTYLVDRGGIVRSRLK